MGNPWTIGAPCLVEDCPTRIQRTPTGTIVDGHVAHLKIVHNIGETRARRLLSGEEERP
jgi:hypothetical protein